MIERSSTAGRSHTAVLGREMVVEELGQPRRLRPGSGGPPWAVLGGGPYEGAKLVHRMVSLRQAALLRRAIANDLRVVQLLRAWEAETERIIEERRLRC